MSNKSKDNYDHLDKILHESQEKPGVGGKVWIESKFHPGGGYWAEPSEVGLTWESLKEVDKIERYLRS